MIVGRNFAIGHIPKTGGDAIHSWCSAVNDDSLIIDPANNGYKHKPFHYRAEAFGKSYYVLAIRRLPEWTLSFLHHISQDIGLVQKWGFRSVEESLHPEAAFRQAFADYHLSRMRAETEITHWLRAGATLLDDLLDTLAEVYRPLTAQDIAKAKAVRVKQPRTYCHDTKAVWTANELETIYRLNPQWSAIENLVFGGFV